MRKVRVITKKTHILEWDNGEKMVPFTLAIKNDITGIVTIRWTYIKKIIVIGYAPDESLYHYSDWVEVGKDE